MLGLRYFKDMLSAAGAFMIFSKGGGVVFIFALLGLGWNLLGPTKPHVDDNRRNVADVVIAKVLEGVREKRGAIRDVALLHLVNDPTDYLTLSLRRQLRGSGILNLEDTPFREKWNNLLSLHNKGVYSFDEAVEYGKVNNLDGVLVGKIECFESFKNGARLIIALQMVDVKAGEVSFSLQFDEDSTRHIATRMKDSVELSIDVQDRLRIIPWYWRILLFVLVTLLLPIITITFIRAMVAKRSNSVNALVLGVYTVLDAIFAFFMIGGSFDSFGLVVLFLGTTGLAFFYNYLLMIFALRLEM